MSDYDDTVARLRLGNSELRGKIKDLIDEEENGDTRGRFMLNSNRYDMNGYTNALSRSTERNNTENSYLKSKVGTLLNTKESDANRTGRPKSLCLGYLDNLKENIEEIKNTDYDLPRKGKNKLDDRLNELKDIDNRDKVHLKQQEGLLLNKLYSQKESIAALREQLEESQTENKLLLENLRRSQEKLTNAEKHLETTREHKQDSTKLEMASQQHRIKILESELQETRKVNTSIEERHRKDLEQLLKSRETARDLATKIVLSQRNNRRYQNKIEGLVHVNGYLTDQLIKSSLENSSAEQYNDDSSEYLMDSTTTKLIKSPFSRSSFNIFISKDTLHNLGPRERLKAYCLAIRFIIRVSALKKREFHFLQRIHYLLKD